MAVGIACNLDLAVTVWCHPEWNSEVFRQRPCLVNFAVISEGAVVHVQSNQVPALLLEHVRCGGGVYAPAKHDDCLHAVRYHT